MTKKGLTIELEKEIELEAENCKTLPTMDTLTLTKVAEPVVEALPIDGTVTMEWNRHHDAQNVMAWTKKGTSFDLDNALYVYGSFDATKGALEALTNYLGHGIAGSPTFLVVAPASRIGSPLATGVFAHVSSEHDPEESVPLMVNGSKLELFVKEEQIPTGPGAWATLRLVGGNLVREPNDPVATAEGMRGGWLTKARASAAAAGTIHMAAEEEAGKTFAFWYAKTASTILAGHNVGISTNKYSEEKVVGALRVAESEDPVAANLERKLGNRKDTAWNRQVAEETQVTILEGRTAEDLKKEDPTLELRVYGSERTVNMANWPIGMPIVLVDENGREERSRFLKGGDYATRYNFVKLARRDGKTILIRK